MLIIHCESRIKTSYHSKKSLKINSESSLNLESCCFSTPNPPCQTFSSNSVVLQASDLCLDFVYLFLADPSFVTNLEHCYFFVFLLSSVQISVRFFFFPHQVILLLEIKSDGSHSLGVVPCTLAVTTMSFWLFSDTIHLPLGE